MNFVKKKTLLLVFLIYLVAIFLRLLYFPNNTYFGFDQARDAYAVKEILSGDLKITGPPTANEVIHHGVLYYYIFAPFYLISQGDPATVSLFLRILNAAGVFILFLLVYPVFGVAVAIFSSLLFAISYEQTQFSLFLNHPSLAVISVLIFYLGLAIWIFRNKISGLPLSLFGLGLSIQFEFVEIQLITIFILFLLVFRKSIPQLGLKEITLGLVAFIVPLSTYLISEIKNGFPAIRQGLSLFLDTSQPYSLLEQIGQIPPLVQRQIRDNLAANPLAAIFLGVMYLTLIAALIYTNTYRKQFIFLALWFFGGFLVYFFIKNDAYFYNTGTSISLLIFSGYILSKLFFQKRSLGFLILAAILFSNISLITKNNPLGPNQRINPQVGLLLKDEQKVLDFIYESSNGEAFAVNALTMPYNVNTTWSYLFEWYGKNKYGYIPVWGGDAAEGFSGNLPVERARSKLPQRRFLIIEPLEGIPSYLVDNFIKNEENYSVTIEKKQIGTMEVWVQQPR